MRWFVLPLVVFASSLRDGFRAPVRVSSLGISLTANITRGRSDGTRQSHEQNLTLSPSESIVHASTVDFESPVLGIWIESDRGPVWLDSTFLSIYANNRIYFPIGFHGRLVTEATQSVMILKNHTNSEIGELVVGGTQNFSNACVPDSIINIVMDRDMLGRPDVFHTNLKLTNRANQSIVHENEFVSVMVVGLAKVMNLPPHFVDYIDRSLSSNGAVRIRGKYENCFLDNLPDLTFDLADNPGSILLGPDDYLDFDADTQTCIPRYRSMRRVDGLMYLDPLFIRDVNVQFTEDTFSLCDSL